MEDLMTDRKTYSLHLSSDQLALIGNLLAQRMGYLISVGADDDRIEEIADVIRHIGNARGVRRESDGLHPNPTAKRR